MVTLAISETPSFYKQRLYPIFICLTIGLMVTCCSKPASRISDKSSPYLIFEEINPLSISIEEEPAWISEEIQLYLLQMLQSCNSSGWEVTEATFNAECPILPRSSTKRVALLSTGEAFVGTKQPDIFQYCSHTWQIVSGMEQGSGRPVHSVECRICLRPREIVGDGEVLLFSWGNCSVVVPQGGLTESAEGILSVLKDDGHIGIKRSVLAELAELVRKEKRDRMRVGVVRWQMPGACVDSDEEQVLCFMGYDHMIADSREARTCNLYVWFYSVLIHEDMAIAHCKCLNMHVNEETEYVFKLRRGGEEWVCDLVKC